MTQLQKPDVGRRQRASLHGRFALRSRSFCYPYLGLIKQLQTLLV